MYQRTKDIVNPSAPDMTNSGATLYHEKFGGKNSSSWVPAGKNKWTASVVLDCDIEAYYLWVGDGQVSQEPIAEKIFLRVKGEDSNWIEMTCIGDSPSMLGGKAVKFVFYNGQIQIPSGY